MFYDYVCKCGHEKEVQHSIKDNPIIKCDKCQEIMKRKIIMNAGIIFKGNGFTKSSIK